MVGDGNLFYSLDKKSGISYTVTVLYNDVIQKGAWGGMSEPERSTLELIHRAAKAEFMEKGFQAASLRNIVKTAGVTTGAFYGYYASKEELFAALVNPAYEYMSTKVLQTLEHIYAYIQSDTLSNPQSHTHTHTLTC